jgi:hypothetical protein
MFIEEKSTMIRINKCNSIEMLLDREIKSAVHATFTIISNDNTKSNWKIYWIRHNIHMSFCNVILKEFDNEWYSFKKKFY